MPRLTSDSCVVVESAVCCSVLQRIAVYCTYCIPLNSSYGGSMTQLTAYIRSEAQGEWLTHNESRLTLTHDKSWYILVLLMIHLHNFTAHVRTTLLYTFVTAVFTWAIRAVKALATWQTHTFWATNFGISYEPTHCNTMQSYVAYSTLQRTATHCHMLQHTATHFKNLAKYCKGLQHTARKRMTFWATNFSISHVQKYCQTLQSTDWLMLLLLLPKK